MRHEYKADQEIEILMETNATINRHSSESTKSKFFSSKERISKKTNDTPIKGDQILQASKKRNLKPKTFWQLHDLK